MAEWFGAGQHPGARPCPACVTAQAPPHLIAVYKLGMPTPSEDNELIVAISLCEIQGRFIYYLEKDLGIWIDRKECSPTDSSPEEMRRVAREARRSRKGHRV